MHIERDERPWGFFEVVDAGPGFQVKRIQVEAGRQLSYQRHAERSEHWYVVSGQGVAIIDGADKSLSPGDAVEIPVGTAHRVRATGSAALVLIEIQTGTSIREDDIERLDDDYGRVL